MIKVVSGEICLREVDILFFGCLNAIYVRMGEGRVITILGIESVEMIRKHRLWCWRVRDMKSNLRQLLRNYLGKVG